MNLLKWLLKAFVIIALMFTGLKIKPKKNDNKQDDGKNARIVRLLN